MGRAEDAYRARESAQNGSDDADFRSQRAEVFAELDRLLVGFAGLAERAGYPDVESVHLVAKGSWLVGWRLTDYDPDRAYGAESYILASTGDLYINKFHFQDPATRDLCAQDLQGVNEAREVASALRGLRTRLGSRR